MRRECKFFSCGGDYLCDCVCSVRHTAQEWLVREFGAYLPGVYEEVCVCMCACACMCVCMCMCMRAFG